MPEANPGADVEQVRVGGRVAAPGSIPTRSAARHTTSGSPTGSAAASCSSRRVSAGRASSRRRKPFSMPATVGTAKPPASSAGLKQRGRASRASGLPRVSATTRSRTRSSSGPGTAIWSNARASASSSPRSSSSGKPRSWSCGRVAYSEHQRDRLRQHATRDKGEHARRSVVEPLEVVHDAEQRALPGVGRQQAERRQRDQELVRGIAGGLARERPWTASRCGWGSSASGSSSGAHNWCTPEYASSISDSTPEICATWKSDACSVTMAQQRGLADARFATDDEHGAMPGAGLDEHLLELRTLAGPAPEPARQPSERRA